MNTRSKHTPGPWAARHDDMVFSKEGRIIADCESTSPPIAEDKANAALVAAAPAMYEALGNLLKMVEDGDYTTIELNEARAAIAQAEGGTL